MTASKDWLIGTGIVVSIILLSALGWHGLQESNSIIKFYNENDQMVSITTDCKIKDNRTITTTHYQCNEGEDWKPYLELERKYYDHYKAKTCAEFWKTNPDNIINCELKLQNKQILANQELILEAMEDNDG